MALTSFRSVLTEIRSRSATSLGVRIESILDVQFYLPITAGGLPGVFTPGWGADNKAQLNWVIRSSTGLNQRRSRCWSATPPKWNDERSEPSLGLQPPRAQSNWTTSHLPQKFKSPGPVSNATSFDRLANENAGDHFGYPKALLELHCFAISM